VSVPLLLKHEENRQMPELRRKKPTSPTGKCRRPADARLSVHYDARCHKCRCTIYAFTRMVIRDGWRLHAYCAGYEFLNAYVNLPSFPTAKDNSDPDARLENPANAR
jgi:hypothetical protein